MSSSSFVVRPSSLIISLRAWLYLVWLSWQRQMRVHLMVWISLGLLGFSAIIVGLITADSGWGMGRWRYPNRAGPNFDQWSVLVGVLPGSAPARTIESAISASCRAILIQSDFLVFSKSMLFSVFLSFLLPMWSLSFATEALGGDRESGSLIWLLSRPLSRPAVYLAKFAALLPWTLGLNLGGFVLLCLLAGRPGPLAIRLYWPAVALATLAFSALFHLMGAYFRLPSVIALVYAFFLETILGNMPGYLKRVSISFYTRCMMYDAAEQYGVEPENPSIYLPVDGTTACWILVGVTVVCLVIGMMIFARKEYVTAS